MRFMFHSQFLLKMFHFLYFLCVSLFVHLKCQVFSCIFVSSFKRNKQFRRQRLGKLLAFCWCVFFSLMKLRKRVRVKCLETTARKCVVFLCWTSKYTCFEIAFDENELYIGSTTSMAKAYFSRFSMPSPLFPSVFIQRPAYNSLLVFFIHFSSLFIFCTSTFLLCLANLFSFTSHTRSFPTASITCVCVFISCPHLHCFHLISCVLLAMPSC